MENQANTPTPDKKLEMIQGQFPENCPPGQHPRARSHGSGRHFRGLPSSELHHLSGGLKVMKFAVASKPGLLLVFNSASPAPHYEAGLPAFNSMEHSIKVLPGPAILHTAAQALPRVAIRSKYRTAGAPRPRRTLAHCSCLPVPVGPCS